MSYYADQITAYPRLDSYTQALHDHLDTEEAFFDDEPFPPEPEAHALFRTSLASHASGKGCRWRLDLIRRRHAAQALVRECFAEENDPEPEACRTCNGEHGGPCSPDA